ncbi:GNAT family N-acetyltransferase [Massilia oculi]|nr:GNAT family N-acetyltransferase [Massilia oculi]
MRLPVRLSVAPGESDRPGGAVRDRPDADTLYLHDLAVDPRALGRGLARALVEHLLDLGRGLDLPHAALVSVQDSTRFWNGFGFEARATSDAGLFTYPPGAVYMARPLD